MGDAKFNCDCDLVIEMEEMGVGMEEILQYAQGVFTNDDLKALIQRLEEMASSNGVE